MLDADSLFTPLARGDLHAFSPASLYDDWSVAEMEASLALAGWSTAAQSDKVGAHADYVATLDAEEQAAVRLQRRLAGAL